MPKELIGKYHRLRREIPSVLLSTVLPAVPRRVSPQGRGVAEGGMFVVSQSASCPIHSKNILSENRGVWSDVSLLICLLRSLFESQFWHTSCVRGRIYT